MATIEIKNQKYWSAGFNGYVFNMCDFKIDYTISINNIITINTLTITNNHTQKYNDNGV